METEWEAAANSNPSDVTLINETSIPLWMVQATYRHQTHDYPPLLQLFLPSSSTLCSLTNLTPRWVNRCPNTSRISLMTMICTCLLSGSVATKIRDSTPLGACGAIQLEGNYFFKTCTLRSTPCIWTPQTKLAKWKSCSYMAHMAIRNNRAR